MNAARRQATPRASISEAPGRKPAAPRYDGATYEDRAVKFRAALGGEATINISD